MVGDLHCHTRFSDGAMGIDDLVLYAKRARMDFIALTDHDTMAGASRAEQLGKRHGIGIISGAEISSFDRARGRKVHLLCYLPKRPDRLEGTFKRMAENRSRSVQESMRKVMQLFPVTEEHIMRYAKSAASLYNVHIMLALVELGYADRVYGSLYAEILGSKGSCYVPREYPDVWEMAELIRSAGGICVLAHPPQYDSFDLLEELAQKGLLDGVERYHPSVQQQEEIERIDQVISRYNLIPTGGTDFHGGNSSRPHPIGTCVTTKTSLERIFKLAKSRE